MDALMIFVYFIFAPVVLVTLFGTLIYLAFNRDRFGNIGTEWPAGWKSRLAGLGVLVFGGGIITFSWWEVHEHSMFSGTLAFLGPLIVAMGTGIIIEGPELPIRKASRVFALFVVVGSIAGGLYIAFLRTGRIPFL